MLHGHQDHLRLLSSPLQPLTLFSRFNFYYSFPTPPSAPAVPAGGHMWGRSGRDFLSFQTSTGNGPAEMAMKPILALILAWKP